MTYSLLLEASFPDIIDTGVSFNATTSLNEGITSLIGGGVGGESQQLGIWRSHQDLMIYQSNSDSHNPDKFLISFEVHLVLRYSHHVTNDRSY